MLFCPPLTRAGVLTSPDFLRFLGVGVAGSTDAAVACGVTGMISDVSGVGAVGPFGII